MQGSIRFLAIGTTLACLSAALAADEAERRMNVTQGPETVFAAQPDEIFTELAGAEATNENGRVGNELVFWGYRLANDREVYFVACAMLATVDCEAREMRVCPGEFEVLARSTSPGLVRHRRCAAIATAAPGDINPGCTDRDSTEAIGVSLLACP